MNHSISYRNVEASEAMDRVLNRQLGKIDSLLRSYDPDLVQLRGHLERHPRRAEFAFRVNLSLPTGTLHATAASADPEMSARETFAELAEQIKKHMSRLRKDFEWKRKRGRMERALA
jgi:ribosome-associated translation inhibitor RaiA